MQQNFVNFGLLYFARCDGKYGIGFVANLLDNRTVIEFGKSANMCRSYEQKYSCTVFLTHCVEIPRNGHSKFCSKNAQNRAVTVVVHIM